MKTILITVLGAALSLQLNAQWSQTNLGGSKAITSHKGKVYALTSASGLQVSSDNGDSWSLVNTDPILNRKDHLVSAGDRLYVATYNVINANGNIYYSTDEGNTWQTDTSGLPNAFFQPTEKTDIHTIMAYGDGELIATLSGLDAYYHKNIADAEWEIIPELASLDPDDYIGSGDTVIAFGSSPTLKISIDNGHTFTDLIGAGLPNYFVPAGVYWDRGKRMYLGVNAPILDKSLFYYSDDKGATWDTFNIAPFIGTDFISQRQKLTAVFGLDDNIYFALNNDQSNSTADIFSSSDGGATFAKDTTGLAVDGFATESVTMFMYNNQRLFSVNSNTDVHYTALAGPTTGIDELKEYELSLYPNPSQGIVHFSRTMSSVSVFSVDGRLVVEVSGSVDFLDLTGNGSGIYFLKSTDSKGQVHSQKMILR